MLGRPIATGLALCALAAAATSVAAPAAATPTGAVCGETYRIKPGDTLSRIAKDVYGKAGSFQVIYSANAGVIGPNPALIEVGMRLDIPCLGDAVTASTADEAVIRPAATTAALPAPDAREIRILAGSDWAPFLHEDLEQGGMVTEVANVAMANADGAPDYKIDFVNDWGAHLRPLITDHAYDFSLGWFRPNCAIADRLSDDVQFRCNNLGWSAPLFEQVFAFYTRADETVAAYADLHGMTVCRPAGYALFMLEEEGLTDATVTLARPDSVSACFAGLVDGSYDVVAMAADTAEGAITDLGATDVVAANEPLAKVLTMHAVISKSHPMADQYLATFDSGIARIKASGEWFEIVRRHLTAHRAKTAG